jgi:hypothetical protein
MPVAGLSLVPYADSPLAGPPGRWVETRLCLAGDGFDTLVFWPVDPSARQVELFADEVVPLLSDD